MKARSAVRTSLKIHANMTRRSSFRNKQRRDRTVSSLGQKSRKSATTGCNTRSVRPIQPCSCWTNWPIG